MEFFKNITLVYWHWLALGVVLAGLEMIVPGAAMLWIGGAAFLTGLIISLFPDMPWQGQLSLFGGLGIAAMIVSRRYLRIKRGVSDDPLLNNRYARLIGHVITLDSPIINNHGRVPVDDGSFLVTGPNLPAGSKVRVTDIQGAVLVVEAVADAAPGTSSGAGGGT